MVYFQAKAAGGEKKPAKAIKKEPESTKKTVEKKPTTDKKPVEKKPATSAPAPAKKPLTAAVTVKKTVAPPTLKKAPGAPKKIVTVQKKPKGTLRGKGTAVKKKKETRKTTINCIHPVEDSIMDVNDFVRLN